MTTENTLEGQLKARLVRAAELTETEIDPKGNKADIVKALEANDVDFDYYSAFVLPQIEAEEAAVESADEEKAEPVKEYEAPKANPGTITTADLGNQEEVLKTGPEKEEVEAYDPEDSDEVLVRYTGFSRLFEKKGYTFRKDHPFAPVKKSEVDALLESSDLLRLASPREAQDFYS